MENNIYAVIIALIAGLTSASGWNYYQKKAELKKENEYSYKFECRARIDKLEDELQKSELDNSNLRQSILELSILVAELKTRLELLEKKS
jgi:predicted negative regulator of RcsB-dependent stress response